MPDDEPIVAAPQSKWSEVIDLDGIRIQWGRPAGRYDQRCPHASLVYSQEERRVWCEDCKRTIENFDAFMVFVRCFDGMVSVARRRLAEAHEAMATSVRRRATKVLDHAWSGGLPAVCCPHCRKGILPEDIADRQPMRTSREYELARRARDKPP